MAFYSGKEEWLTNKSGLSNEKIRLIETTFNECDENKKGYLNREDLKVAMISLFGYKPSKLEVDQLMAGAERQSNQGLKNTMSLQHFLKVMSSKMAASDEDDEIRQTFLAFDSQCHGFLTVSDLKKVFSQIAPHMQEHAIESAFREIDRDGDGRVSYKDFEFMMKYSLDDGF